MAVSKGVILLFEDDPKIAAKFRVAIRPHLGRNLVLESFPLDRPTPPSDKPYEDRVVEVIQASGYKDDIALIVTDRDLSTQSSNWRGLSQASVSPAARRLGIPVSCYRSRVPNVAEDFRRVPGDGLIELADDAESRAKQAVILARGFIELSKRVNEAHDGPAARTDALLSPGMLLASILGQPAAAAHLDTFACGDQLAIAEILTFSREEKKVSAQIRRRLISALGVWLADLVMKFPGVLVNAKAAASYLDVHPMDFAKPEVQRIFARARYKNLPFANEESPLWWRHLLDDILQSHGSSTGQEFCTEKGLRRIRFCPCSVNPSLHAGFLDMANGEPISAQNSSGRVRWFPPGADLARLNKIAFRRLGPWIGS